MGRPKERERDGKSCSWSSQNRGNIYSSLSIVLCGCSWWHPKIVTLVLTIITDHRSPLTNIIMMKKFKIV